MSDTTISTPTQKRPPAPEPFPVASIRKGAFIQHYVDQEHYEVSRVGDWFTDPLGFVVWNKTSGTREVDASAVIAVHLEDGLGWRTVTR